MPKEKKEGSMEDEGEVHGIVIVGGGICGLATALALHRKGIRSLVLEKSETLRADGAALGVHANGWRALDQLGVAAELRETASLITEYRNVWQQQNKTTLVPVRQELRCLKRKDLIETLAKSLPAGAVRFGCQITAIEERSGGLGAVLTTVDGRTINTMVLIGCDGSNSVVAKYLGLNAPSQIPRTFFRGFTRYPHGHTFGAEFLRLRGKDFFAGLLPVTDNLVHFIIARSTGPDITRDIDVMRDFVLENLRECPKEITEMVRNSDTELLNVVTKVWYVPPWRVMMLGSFQRGTVIIAGDAMHAMGPFIGQGGSAGLEDAVVLARSLSPAVTDGGVTSDGELHKKISAVLGKYLRERRPRVVRLSLESFVMGALLRAKSTLRKLLCRVILALLGTESLRHTEYDCGRL